MQSPLFQSQRRVSVVLSRMLLTGLVCCFLAAQIAQGQEDEDAGVDAGADVDAEADAGVDAGVDAGADVDVDAGADVDAGEEIGPGATANDNQTNGAEPEVDTRHRGQLGVMVANRDGRLLIDTVMAGGAAAHAGLHAGDEIISVDGHRVATPSQLIRRLKAIGNADGTATIVVFRDDAVETIEANVSGRYVAESRSVQVTTYYRGRPAAPIAAVPTIPVNYYSYGTHFYGSYWVPYFAVVDWGPFHTSHYVPGYLPVYYGSYYPTYYYYPYPAYYTAYYRPYYCW